MKRLTYLFVSLTILGLIVLGCEKSQSPIEATSQEDDGVKGLKKAETYMTNQIIPYTHERFIPCAAGGDGEIVSFSGDMHFVNHITIDAAGGIHWQLHYNPQNFKGVGLTTGDTYQNTGMEKISQNNTNGALELLVLSTVHYVGPGPDNNFTIHQSFKATLNADWEVIVWDHKSNVDCK